MIVIGLTGPTGAGKSTVAAMLRARGLYIADADLAAREILSPGSPVLQAVCASFGDVLQPDGSLDRKALAKRAFACEENVRTLNRLTHPAIERYLFAQIEANASGCAAAVIDAAALIESGIADKCDLVAVVTAPREVRLARIMARDGLTPEQALQRIGAQKDDAFYTAHADVVLLNDGVRELAPQVQTLLERIPEV